MEHGLTALPMIVSVFMRCRCSLRERRLAGCRDVDLAAFRRRGARRSSGLLLGALALLIQISLPTVHAPSAVARFQTAASARAFFGGSLAFCLASGTERSRSPLQTPAEQPLPCPLCATAQDLESFIPPEPITIAANPWLAGVPGFVAPAPIVARALDPAIQPRAPPLAT
jgi:hypothetical protein